jgi:hypothetical protein
MLLVVTLTPVPSPNLGEGSKGRGFYVIKEDAVLNFLIQT